MSFFEFPHTRTYDSDLGWMIRHLKYLSDQVEDLKILSSITVSDPVVWDITRSYIPHVIVMHDGNGYVSTKPVPPGIDISNSEYWLQILDFNDLVQYDEYQYWYPEMSGAVGDGETDDTAAMQAAIDECAEHGYLLRLRREHTYKITEMLTFTEYINIEGNCSTIKAGGAMTWMLYFDLPPRYDGIGTDLQNRIDLFGHGFVRDLTLDCNSMAVNGLHTSGYLLYFRNINVMNVNGTGIYLGGISRLENVNVTCNPIGGTIGINLHSNDNVLIDIVVINASTAYMINGYNRVSHITAWNQFPQCYSGSVFIHDTNPNNLGERYELIECYCDTYQTMYKASNRNRDPKFIGCRFQIDETLTAGNTENSYILYGEGADNTWFNNVVFTDCVLIGKYSNFTKLCNKETCKANFEINNTFIHLSGVKEQIYNELSAVAGVTVNDLRIVKDGTLSLVNIDVSINVPQTEASSNFNIVTLGVLPANMRPLRNLDFVYHMRLTGDNEYFPTRFYGGMINATNGRIMLMIPTDLLTQTALRCTAQIPIINTQIRTMSLGNILNDNT